MRTTNANLEHAVDRLNRIAERDRNPDKPTVGSFVLSRAYGGVSLHEMSNERGGVRSVFRCGHVPKARMLALIEAFTDGMEVENRRANP